MRPTERLRELQAVVLDDWFANRLHRVVAPTQEKVLLVQRRHWLVLAAPALLTLGGCAVALVARDPRLWLAVIGAGLTYLGRRRHRWSDVRTGLVAALWVVPLWLSLDVPTALVRVGAVYVFLVYLLVAVARWLCTALVLTETSLWILSGVVTTHSPRAPLSQIVFQDVRQNIAEELLRCGTLSFDTAASTDDPLAGFGPVAEPFEVSAQIHQQRLKAMRRSLSWQQSPPPSQEQPPAPPAAPA
jgi:hypothetical protein